MKSFLNPRVGVVIAVIFSGICFYLSLGLSGGYSYLFWLAPVPVLAISFRTSAGKSFFIAFAAYLMGKLSWFTYLVSVVTIIPAIVFTLLLPLIFALIVILTRSVVVRSKNWYSVFAFPVFFTSFEFLVLQFSADGSAGSIAYSQANILPIIQIASLTGILGITFIITFIPSAIAVLWHYRKQKDKTRYIAICALITVATVIVFGAARLSQAPGKNKMKVGLAALDEKLHYITRQPDTSKGKLSAEAYAELISQLADEGVKLVVLPERAININRQTQPVVASIFSDVAKRNHIFIIAGYTNFKTDIQRNSSLVIDTAGNVVVDYNKVYLVPGLEKQFTPGKNIGLFAINNMEAGTAICKDLDFPAYIKKYGRANTVLMTIPAWDFVKDDWLHSRMAVLRGVENGFSEIRTARQGRLTISDAYGRVTSEANSSGGRSITLSGDVSLQKINTLYSRTGDWFGIASCMAAIVFVLLLVIRKKTGDL